MARQLSLHEVSSFGQGVHLDGGAANRLAVQINLGVGRLGDDLQRPARGRLFERLEDQGHARGLALLYRDDLCRAFMVRRLDTHHVRPHSQLLHQRGRGPHRLSIHVNLRARDGGGDQERPLLGCDRREHDDQLPALPTGDIHPLAPGLMPRL